MSRMSKTIEVIVSPDGQTRVETKGFTGTECRQASEFLEKALGRRSSEQLTAEFHQEQQAGQSNQQQN
jgi:hypothetical protein